MHPTPLAGRNQQTNTTDGRQPAYTTMPGLNIQISVIVAVYNDWIALDECLHSIEQQDRKSGLEIIVVDDGSEEPAPQKIRERERSLPLKIVRQPHAGISASRNHGISLSSGSILLFTDADCRLEADCLAALESTIAATPQRNYFQLRLIGDCSRFVGKTEHLRLIAIQSHTLQANGCIRYLNTAGFAVRRSGVQAQVERGLFDPAALRGEDTLLLAGLIEHRDLPFFVAGAAVQHDVALSVLQCLRKDMQSAFLEGKTFALIAARGIKVRMSNRERLSMIRRVWMASREPSIGRAAWFVLTMRQALARLAFVVYRLRRGRSDLRSANPSLETQL